jgi:glycosyltransferase involved in cell wall biosynthesis
MRILFVSHVPKNPDGGASRVYHLLENGFASRGHVVKTLHYENFGIVPFGEKFVRRLFLPVAASRRASKELESEYDVVMSSNGMLYPLFRKLKQSVHRPLLVSHYHGLSFFDHQAIVTETMRGHMSTSLLYRFVTGPLTLRWDAQGSQYADLSIVQNGRDLDFLLEQGSVPVSIPLSVHPEILAAGMFAPRPPDRDPLSLLWFGSWVERKGIHYLPRAFAQIAERFPGAHLTLGGTGVAPNAVKSKFESNLWARVTCLPQISLKEQVAEYARHAIFLFPSLSEGFGFALLEAMSMGLAVVATHTGLSGDWLKDRENALIIPAGSAVHLAEAVITLIDHDDLRYSVAKNGQELSRSFTFDRLIDSYENAFEKYRRCASSS